MKRPTRRQALAGAGTAIGTLTLAGAADRLSDGELDGNLEEERELTRNQEITQLMDDKTDDLNISTSYNGNRRSDTDNSTPDSEVKSLLEPNISFTGAWLDESDDKEIPVSTLNIGYDTDVGLDAYDKGNQNEWDQQTFAEDGYAEDFANVTSDALREVKNVYGELLDTPEDINGLNKVTLRFKSTDEESENYALWTTVNAEELADMNPEKYSKEQLLDDSILWDGDSRRKQPYHGE